MNELICKNEDCNETLMCDEDVVVVTCHYCCAVIGTTGGNEDGVA